MAANPTVDLLTRIGWSAAAAAEATRQDGQDLAYDHLLDMEDEDAEELFTALRRPGDQVPNAVGDMVPRPGVSISARGKTNFKLACYAIRYYARVNRTLAVADVDTDLVRRFRRPQEMEKEHLNPTEIMKLEDSSQEKILRLIEIWPDHLRGTRGHPLSYIIRENSLVPPEGDSTAFGEANSSFATVDEELIERGSLTGGDYGSDNAAVYELLKQAVVDFKDVYNWIKPFNSGRDGRGAWMAFRQHYMGDAFLNTLYDKADRRLLSLHYTGEKPRYNYEKHVSLHRQSHNEAVMAQRPFDKRVMVGRLLDSIKAKELEAAVAVVRADATKIDDFEGTINYLRNFVKPLNRNEQFSVSQVTPNDGNRGRDDYRGGHGRGGGRGGRGRYGQSNRHQPYGSNRGGRGGGRGGSRGNRSGRRDTAEVRWYNKEEWWNDLSEEQRAYVTSKRQQQMDSRSQGEKQGVSEVKVQENGANPSGGTSQRE